MTSLHPRGPPALSPRPSHRRWWEKGSDEHLGCGAGTCDIVPPIPVPLPHSISGHRMLCDLTAPKPPPEGCGATGLSAALAVHGPIAWKSTTRWRTTRGTAPETRGMLSSQRGNKWVHFIGCHRVQNYREAELRGCPWVNRSLAGRTETTPARRAHGRIYGPTVTESP